MTVTNSEHPDTDPDADRPDLRKAAREQGARLRDALGRPRHNPDSPDAPDQEDPR